MVQLKRVRISNEEYTEMINIATNKVGFHKVMEDGGSSMWWLILLGYLTAHGFDFSRTIDVDYMFGEGYSFMQR